jgi:hypothetical protein
MPFIYKELPPDHPLFSVGPSFVFRNDEVDAEHLVGAFTREELLGEPDAIEFLQPKRPAPRAKDVDEGGE